jgi:hypothetical protein
MTERWEYKLIVWSSVTETRGEPGTYPSGESKRKIFWRSQFKITTAGEEPETRLNYSNHDEDEGRDRHSIENLLNEFGAEGWELVSEAVLDNTIVSNHAGWPKVGTPVEVRWIMKRRKP